MPYAQHFNSDVILTTGCVVDICSTGRECEILETLQLKVYLPAIAYYDNPMITIGNDDKKAVSLQECLAPLIKADLLMLTEPKKDQEWDDFYTLTEQEQLSNQHAGAVVRLLANRRRWLVGCNDLRTMKWLDIQQPVLHYVAAVDFFKHWAEKTQANQREVADMLLRACTNVYCSTRKDHPLYSWWNKHILFAEGSQS